MSISTPNAISTPNTSPTITTDALIIGFGKGGKTLAAKLSAAGRKVVVAEASADMYGGTCINIGCLPSKSLLLSAEQARRDGANSTPETREAAFEAAIKEKRRVTSMLRDKNYHKLADQDNITVITGRAHFTGPHSVEIATAEGPVAVTASKDLHQYRCHAAHSGYSRYPHYARRLHQHWTDGSRRYAAATGDYRFRIHWT